MLNTSGRIIDLKTASRKPTGVSADYAFQVASYRQLCPGASGMARVDTLVATKVPQVITQEYTVSAADMKMTETLYPLVREAMREGIYLPNRSSNLCSYKHCAFAVQTANGKTLRPKQSTPASRIDICIATVPAVR